MRNSSLVVKAKLLASLEYIMDTTTFCPSWATRRGSPYQVNLSSYSSLQVRHLTCLARVSFGYLSGIYILDNPTGFIPNSFALRITPDWDTLLACSSSSEIPLQVYLVGYSTRLFN